MKPHESFLGRYEANTRAGMVAYLEISRKPEGGYEYAYGIGQFPPKERVFVPTDAEILEKIGNALGEGYAKVKTDTELKEERELEKRVAGFDFMGWLAKRD